MPLNIFIIRPCTHTQRQTCMTEYEGVKENESVTAWNLTCLDQWQNKKFSPTMVELEMDVRNLIISVLVYLWVVLP